MVFDLVTVLVFELDAVLALKLVAGLDQLLVMVMVHVSAREMAL